MGLGNDYLDIIHKAQQQNKQTKKNKNQVGLYQTK